VTFSIDPVCGHCQGALHPSDNSIYTIREMGWMLIGASDTQEMTSPQ